MIQYVGMHNLLRENENFHLCGRGKERGEKKNCGLGQRLGESREGTKKTFMVDTTWFVILRTVCMWIERRVLPSMNSSVRRGSVKDFNFNAWWRVE